MEALTEAKVMALQVRNAKTLMETTEKPENVRLFLPSVGRKVSIKVMSAFWPPKAMKRRKQNEAKPN